MNEIMKNIEKKLALINKKDKDILQICKDGLTYCVSFYTQKDAILILDKYLKVKEADQVFLEWFNLKSSDVVGKNFVEIFDKSYEDLVSKLFENDYSYKEGIFLKINRKKHLLDLEIRKFKDFYLVSFKDREFDDLNYKLSLIEKKIAELIIRIKDFNVLMKEVIDAFIESNLFDFAWVGKIDAKVKKVVPIVKRGDVLKDEFSFEELEHVFEVLLKRKDLIFEDVDGYKTEIIFPIFNKWEGYDKEHIAYVILGYSKEKMVFKESEINRFRDIIYKLNTAISDIMLKDIAKLNLYKDPLTTLYTRKIFDEKIEHLIKDEIPFAVAIADIDNLSKVNDVLGFWAGDEILKKVADYILTIEADLVARIGGDEFGIIIKDSKSDIFKSLDKLLEFNKQLVKINGSEVFLPISVGVAFFPEDSLKKDDLILKAEKALEVAKKKGGQRIEYSSKSFHLLPKDYLELEKELKEGVEKNEYVLFYQPIVDLHSKSIWGVEALIRWISKKRGIVSPGIFIPILEDSGLINKVGEFIMEEVVKTAKEFENLKISFSMNISVKQLYNRNLANELIQRANFHNINKENLVVEITESVLMENLDIFKDQINILSKNGIKIEIDDFGTGYSSLAYLKRLPVYALKIDKSFIDDIVNSEESLSLVNAIVSMAKALHKKTIAEGVETKEQLKILKKMGVDKIQGFYFAKPMPKEELRKYIKEFDFNKYL